MSIPFTQFRRPDGEPVEGGFNRPEEIEALAKELIEAGYRFEIEVLSGGMVNMDCSRPDDDEPLCGEFCDNGPDVPAAVDRLVTLAHELWRTR